MTRTTLRGTLGLAAMLALAAILPAASPAALVPPGNSAVNQYTETYPAAGGQSDGGNGPGGNRSPAAALGHRNARRLQAQGADGRAAAELAAATAPARAGATGKGSPASAAPGQSGSATGAGAKAGEPSGSSGLAEVLRQATGSSSTGEMGLLLPLIIVATLAGSLIYLAGRRRRPTA
jgi:hypothetical protein